MNARGVALITGLLLLVAISLLALVAASGMILQKHMASNYEQDSKALENAEIALSDAHAWLYSRPNHERESGCISPCLLPTGIFNTGEVPTLAEFESSAWWQLNGIEAGINPGTGETVIHRGQLGYEPPRWILEEIHYQSLAGNPPEDGTIGVGYYRILGRGTANHPASVAVTESIVARPWGDAHLVNAFPPLIDSDDFCLQFEEIAHPQLVCGRLAWRQRR